MFDRSANLISLFASSSTLICCALPAVFIVIGAGATFAKHHFYIPFFGSDFKIQSFYNFGISSYIGFCWLHKLQNLLSSLSSRSRVRKNLSSNQKTFKVNLLFFSYSLYVCYNIYLSHSQYHLNKS